MKRLGRWLFNIAAGVSLLLAIATLVLWLRCNWTADNVSYNMQDGPGSNAFSLASANGRVRLLWTHWDTDPLPDLFSHGLSSFKITHNNPATVARRFALDGTSRIGLRRNLKAAPGASASMLWFPHWVVIVLTALLPAIWAVPLFTGIKARNRRLKGKCANCGYDLRATPDRCPECGTIPSAAKEAAP